MTTTAPRQGAVGDAVFDAELVARYDRPGPRYTSYPTAPQFAALPPHEARLLYAAVPPAAPISLYVHLPFCRSVCYFCACNVIYTKDRARAAAYVDLVARELDLVIAAMAGPRPVAQLHLGGGTPTFLAPRDLERLLLAVDARFAAVADGERGVELDPRETTPEHVEVLVRHGFNRASLGVQDLDPVVQHAVHRLQPLAQTQTLIECLRATGQFPSINVDLIYGLPYQTPPSFARTLDAVLDLRPERIALFNFAHVPWLVSHQRRIDAERLPAPADKLQILSDAVARVQRSGYAFVGMDHFALPDDELVRARGAGRLTRNFQGYSVRRADAMIGVGVTSIGEVAGDYVQNVKDVAAYAARLQAGELPVERGLRLSADDRLRRDVIRRLMCEFRVDKAAIAAAHGIDFDRTFAAALAALEPLAADGLVSLDAEAIVVSPRGRFLVRNLAMAFDAYLAADRARGQRYSRTV